MKNTIRGQNEFLIFSAAETVSSAVQKMGRYGIETATIKGSHERFLIKKFLEIASKMGLGSNPVWQFTFGRISYKKREKRDKGFLKKISDYFPEFKKILPFLLDSKERVFLVGGSVRDIILSIPPKEIDVMIEGDALKFAKEMAKITGGNIKNTHPTFGTATIEVQGIRMDLARARKDFYPSPCSDPVIKWAKAEEDPIRRDFTVNALIFDLKNALLIDVTNGLEDIEKKLITPITPISFYEDPTRLQRGIRLAVRLGFELSEDFLVQVEGVKKNLFMEKLPRERLFAEDKLILEEEKPSLIIKECIKLGVFPNIFPFIPPPSQKAMEEMDRAISYKGVVEKLWYLRLLIWFKEVPLEKREKFVKRFIPAKTLSSSLISLENLKTSHPLGPEEELFLEKFQ